MVGGRWQVVGCRWLVVGGRWLAVMVVVAECVETM